MAFMDVKFLLEILKSFRNGGVGGWRRREGRKYVGGGKSAPL